MPTDVTAVITKIKDSNPVIEFTETSALQSTHDVRYEMGYDITNNQFVLGDGINRTSGLNNSLFSIDDATQQITLGPRTKLIDSTINHQNATQAVAAGSTTLTVAGGDARLYTYIGDVLYKSDGSTIGVVTAVNSATEIVLGGGVFHVIGANEDFYVARHLVRHSPALVAGPGEADITTGATFATDGYPVGEDARTYFKIGDTLFQENRTAPFYKLIGQVTAIGGAGDKIITLSIAVQLAAGTQEIKNNSPIFINRPNPLVKLTNMSGTGAQGLDLLVNNAGGYPISEDTITVDPEIGGTFNATHLLSAQSVLYDSAGHLLGGVSKTTATVVTIPNGIHHKLADNQGLYQYLSMTGVLINNVSGYTRGHKTAINVDGVNALIAFDVGDKIANAKGQILGQITNIASATSIFVKDDTGGGLRIAVADNDKLFKVTHTHLTINPRDGSLNCQSLYINQDLRVNGVAKFGSNNITFDMANDEGEVSLSSENKDTVLAYAINNGTEDVKKFRHGIDNSDSDIFKFEAVNTGSSNDFGHSDHNQVMTVTTAGVLSLASTDALTLSSTTGDINFQDAGVNQLSIDMDGTAGEVIMQLKVDSDDFVFKQFDGTEVFRVEDDGSFDIAGGAGSSGVTVSSAGQLTADGRVLVDDTTDATSKTDGSLQTDGGLSVAKAIYNGTAATLAADSGVVTMGSATAATVSEAGIINVNNTTDATSKTDGSLQTDGGLSVAKAIYNGTAATLAADSGVVTMGSSTAATVSEAGIINVNNTTDATSKTDGSLQTDGGLSVAKAIYNGTAATLAADSGVVTMGSSTAATVSAAGIVNVNNTTEATTTTDGSLQTDGGLSVAKSAVIGDDLDLLSNAAVFKVGSDQPFTLTHANANNTLLASADHRLAFGDAGEYISGDGTDMKIISSGDVDITATLVDVTGALTTSGRVQVDDTTDATSKTDGSLQTDGGLSVAKAIYNGTAATLAADSGVVTMGSSTAATVSADGIINVNNTTDATSKTNGSLQTDGGLSVAKAIYNGTAATLAADSGVVTMGSATAATVSAAGIVNVNNITDATSTTDGSLQTDGGLSVAKDCVFGNDVKLLSDSAVLNFGASSEINLTHVADTGLILAENTNNATGPTLRLSNARGENAGVNNDVAGTIEFLNNDDGNNSQSFGNIKTTATAVANGSESGKMEFGVATTTSGAVATVLTITGGADASSSTTTIAGHLTVNGTTTTVNSTTVTIDDPVFTLGGDGAGLNDSKDRGIEFKYNDGSAKVGFFGYDNNTGVFTGFTDATNTSEVFSGTVMPATFGAIIGTTGTYSGILKTDDTTDATSKTDGSLQTDGGLSVAKAIYNGTAATLAADSGVVTMGSSTAATVSADGIINVNNTTEATTTTDGSLQTDGGLSVAKSAVIGDDLDLLSNAAVFKVGSDQPFTLTHANANNTLLASADHRLAFGDAGEYISGDGTDMKIISSGDVDITATLVDVTGALTTSGRVQVDDTTDATSKTDGSLQTDGGLSVAKAIYNGTAATLAADSGVVTMGSSTAATVSADGIINVNNTTEATTTTDGSLQTDGGLSVAKSAVIGDDLDLLSDGAILNIGSTSKFTLTDQGANNCVMASANHRLAFGDAGEYISGDGTDMKIISSGDVDITATLVDVTGALTTSGRVQVDDTTEATSTTDGSLQTDGGLSVAKSAVIGDDLDLLSNAAVFKVGSDQPFTLTHANANNTLLASTNHRLAFGDAGEYISGDGTDMKIISSGDVDITATLVDVTGALTTSGRVQVDDTTEATSTTDGSLQTDGGLSVAKSAVIGDDLDLLSNAAVFKVGSDQPFTLTHANANNTLLASTNHRLAFGDAGEYISGDGTDMKIISSGDVDITATLVDVTGALTTSGRVQVDDTTEATSTTDGSLQTDGGLSVAKSAVIGDDLDLLSDGAILNIGSTSKFTLTDQGANNCVMASANHRLTYW